MVNYDLISIIAFYGLLFLFFLKYKHKFTIQGKVFALYKTRLGLKLMDKIGKFSPKLMKGIGYLGVVVGFLGMTFIFSFLIRETFKYLTQPGTPPPLAPVLPGISIPGAPTLSFWHWIISIFFVAIVHEFAHGVFARVHKIKIKSSGFAFLGPILAAFVEPDEKEMEKTSTMKQLSVLAAGPFSNIMWGVIFFLILSFVITPFAASLFQPGGITVTNFVEGFPAEQSGLTLPFTILQVNNQDTLDIIQFSDSIKTITPESEVLLVTDQGEFSLTAATNPEDAEKGFIGISNFAQKKELREKYKDYKILAKVVLWFHLLTLWLFIINIGVGLFNLLPLGPVDGGRMFLTAALKIFKNKIIALRAFAFVSWICIALILINLWPWVVKFFLFLAKGFILLIALF